jgi:hypothetical protein
VVQKKNDRRSVVVVVVGTWLWWRWLCIYELLYVYLLFVSVFLTSVVEIGRDASPEYWCRHCVVDNLDGLTIDEVVAVFSHSRVFCIPLFKIDVNIVIVYFVRIVGGGGGRCYPLPFWKSELSRFYDDFIDFPQPCFIDNGREFFMGDFA